MQALSQFIKDKYKPGKEKWEQGLVSDGSRS